MAISFNSRTSNSADQRLSRYTQGGETDRFAKRLGWWERTLFERRTDDITYTIQTHEDRRPDLVAKNVYGQVSLMWLVLQYNTIVDIETEFLAGKTLTLPTPQRVMLEIVNKPVGGKPVSK